MWKTCCIFCGKGCAAGKAALCFVRFVGTGCAVSGVFTVRKIPLKTFHRNVSKIKIRQAGHKGGAVLFAPPSKSYRFSHPPSPCAKSMAQGISLSADSDSGGSSPPKNLSPTVLSWISLTSPTISVLFVSARYFEVLFLRFYGILSGHGVPCPYKTMIFHTQQNGQPLSGLPTIFAVISDACLTDGCNR